MLKKKQIKKFIFNTILNYITTKIINNLYTFKIKTPLIDKYSFNLTNKIRQFNFSFNNLNLIFFKTISTGVVLREFIKKFKFFKKSMFNLNPLIFRLKLKYTLIFTNIYIWFSLNFSKKHYIFIKKFLEDPIVNVKYFLFTKTWKFSKKPIKRIKRRVLRLIKQL